ncbi:DUF2058 family protein [Cocleimonas sp. KMM 6892]|uniref:DUF2058 family protein n=1 Tax=unclassified Cocleimonas TaxID=2639732 RepID=UPI002DBE3EF2|nr:MULTISPECIES: DUF2058 family protein [unclassified Cocleimonas]MEB8432838.1 DUF2058 family protein [Cocleimonas sp. KMM 6892]MEC4715697.1 DUF2058 family protein [Cocleimonas sp. KMM 6895]MEC4744685.1 DUF2058 family protein [Cocleimonas sp. KMM 6896]
MSSLSDQLLKAGLVTEDQVKKAAEKPKPKKKFTGNRNNPKAKQKPVSNRKSASSQKQKREVSDLEQFYKERSALERNEKQAALKKKQEAERIKKETNGKINKLITENLKNDEAADIRYNFVVGTTIKYLFVTEEQQQELADGSLAITFLGGKRSLIPIEIAKEITALNPNKIVIVATDDDSADSAEVQTEETKTVEASIVETKPEE